MGPSDTDPEATRAQLQLLRQASVAQRFARVRSLSATVIELAKRALRRRHPELAQPELDLLFVERHYGPELAEGLRRNREEQSRAE